MDKEPKGAENRQAEKPEQGNKMGSMNIGPLLLNMSTPIIISMLVQALYNVVDSIFVARLGEGALAAVGFVFSVQLLLMSLVMGTAVGVNSLLSRRLGAGDLQGASKAATNGVFLAVIGWIVFALIGALFSDAYLALFNVSAEIAKQGADYMRIVTIGSIGMFLGVTFSRLLQATGRTVYSMGSQLVGAIVNIVLDPIMIFGWFGFPALGVAGAAWATIIGQIASMFVALAFNLKKNPEVKLDFRGFRPCSQTIKKIYQVGIPSIVMQSIGSVMTFFMNQILVGFGTVTVSLFSVYFRLQSFVIMPVLGVNNSMISIISFNYGAQKRKRILKTIRVSILMNSCFMFTGVLIFWLFPEQLLSLFDAQSEMMEIGVPALRILSLSFIPAGVSVALSGSFQALGQGVYSLIMSLVRQLIFVVPVAWVLARFFGIPELWLAFPIAEAGCVVCGVVLYKRIWENRIKHIPNE